MNLASIFWWSFVAFAVVNAHGEIYPLLFPSYIRPAENGDDYILRLSGVVFQFKEKHAVFSSCTNYGLCKQTTLYDAMKADLPQRYQVMYETENDRTQLFRSRRPADLSSVEIKVSMNGEKVKLNSWTKFGRIRAVKSYTGGVNIKAPLTQSGHFEVEIPVVIQKELASGQTNESGKLYLKLQDMIEQAKGLTPIVMIKAALKIPGIQKYFLETECPTSIMGTKPTQIQIVTDVDDTIKISKINQGIRALLKAAFFEAYEAVPFMPDFFKKLASEADKANTQIAMNYLSASYWPLLPPYINQFIQKDGFLWGSFTPRAYVPLQRKYSSSNSFSFLFTENTYLGVDGESQILQKRGLFSSKSKSLETERSTSEIKTKAPSSGAFKHKTTEFEKMAKGPAWKRVIFLGDSGEYDPEIYRELVRSHKFYDQHGNGKIQCVLIRFAPPKNPLQETKEYNGLLLRLRQLFSGFPGWEERVNVYRNGEDLMDINFVDGLCHSTCKPNIWAAPVLQPKIRSMFRLW